MKRLLSVLVLSLGLFSLKALGTNCEELYLTSGQSAYLNCLSGLTSGQNNSTNYNTASVIYIPGRGFTTIYPDYSRGISQLLNQSYESVQKAYKEFLSAENAVVAAQNAFYVAMASGDDNAVLSAITNWQNAETTLRQKAYSLQIAQNEEYQRRAFLSLFTYGGNWF